MNKAEQIEQVEKMVSSLSSRSELYHFRAAMLMIVKLIRDLQREATNDFNS